MAIEQALPAAVCGLAAARQGRYWEMFDQLVKAPFRDTEHYKLDLAHKSGIADVEAFRADLKDPMLAAQVRYESALVYAADALLCCAVARRTHSSCVHRPTPSGSRARQASGSALGASMAGRRTLCSSRWCSRRWSRRTASARVPAPPSSPAMPT